MNDPIVVAGALVTVIAAISAAIVSVINAKAATDDRKEAKAMRVALDMTTRSTDAKADTIIEKAVEIHTLTNSNLSKVTESLNVALEKIVGLEKMVTALNDAKKVADTLASAPATTPAAAVPAARADAGNLKKIETNTAEMAVNTKRTDAIVSKLKGKP